MDTRSMSVEKFDGNNFRQWKFQIKCALKAKGIDITQPRPEGDSSTWLKNDGMAMFVITSNMDLKQITLIENCETANEIMLKLESIYEQKSELNKMIIHERFYQYRMSPNDTIAQHISKIENLAKQLKESGEVVSETAIMTKILGTLPPKYRTLRQAWLSLDSSMQNIVNLTARLLDEEASLTCEEEQETAFLVTNSKSKGQSIQNEHSGNGSKQNYNKHRFECYNCGKRGHFAKECRAPKRFIRKPDNMLAFNIENKIVFDDENIWILDSGASAHITYRRNIFLDLEECSQKSLTLGNEHLVEVCGIGRIKIERFVNGQWHSGILNDVLYVPSLRRNLFSEGVIMRQGYSLIKKGNSALIYLNRELVMSAEIKTNNLYELNIKTVIPAKCNIVQDSIDIRKWHERLGHINLKEIKNMNINSVVEGLKIKSSTEENYTCEACAYGKQHRQSFQKSSRSEIQPGDLVYSDLCGPMSHTSVQGMRYFVLFKDAKTSYRHVYFMRNKSDVLEYFKIYNAMIKNKYMHSVKILHTDNGKEYVNNAFKEYMEKEGIMHELTAPYTPEQNGRAEREFRTIVESARSMLYARDVSLYLWAEAVNTAVYLLNRTSSSQSPNKTPFESWTGVKPQLSHVRVFGSEGYVHIPDQLRKKLDKKSEKMILVGYDNNNYRMYNPKNKQIKISRNVIFDEDKVPEMRTNISKILIDEEDTDTESNINKTEEDIIQENSAENLDSCQNDDDPSYEPSQEIEDIEERQINLRPRYNRNYEANFVEFTVPSTYEEAMRDLQKDKWSKAVNEELEAHEDNKTWTIVKRTNQRTITAKWVFAIKRDENGEVTRYKARLCARGFRQVKGIDYEEIFSPTIRYDSIRIILSLAAKYNFAIQQFDVKTAFLNGNLDEDIYLEVPEGVSVSKDYILKLNKALYGLKQASRCWNKKFTNFLKEFGFIQSQADNCIYIGEFNGIKIYLLIFVDDCLVVSSNKNLINKIMIYLKQAFKIKELNLTYFVGMQIVKESTYILIHQRNYIEQIIKKFNMNDANPVKTPSDVNVTITKNLDEDTVNFPYRELIGSLLFLCSVSRPDISFIVNLLSRYVNSPKRQHVNAAKRIVRYLIDTKDLCIAYRDSNSLIGYSDSDFASDIDTRKSTTGYIFLLNGGPITWSSQKQKTIALSTTEAEFVAASESAKEIIWLKQLLYELGEIYDYVTLHVDNQSAIKLINNPIFHKRTKHIDVKYNFIREKVEEGVIKIKYISSSNQLADILTKSLPAQAFIFLRNHLLFEY